MNSYLAPISAFRPVPKEWPSWDTYNMVRKIKLFNKSFCMAIRPRVVWNVDLQRYERLPKSIQRESPLDYLSNPFMVNHEYVEAVRSLWRTDQDETKEDPDPCDLSEFHKSYVEAIFWERF